MTVAVIVTHIVLSTVWQLPMYYVTEQICAPPPPYLPLCFASPKKTSPHLHSWGERWGDIAGFKCWSPEDNFEACFVGPGIRRDQISKCLILTFHSSFENPVWLEAARSPVVSWEHFLSLTFKENFFLGPDALWLGFSQNFFDLFRFGKQR